MITEIDFNRYFTDMQVYQKVMQRGLKSNLKNQDLNGSGNYGQNPCLPTRVQSPHERKILPEWPACHVSDESRELS
jgi:hypothetical protein